MGYDMYWRIVPKEMDRTVEALKKNFDSAIKERDHTKVKFAKQITGKDFSWNEPGILALPELDNSPYKEQLEKLQQDVEDSISAMEDAKEYYFRANIWGMGSLATIMNEFDLFSEDMPELLYTVTSDGYEDSSGRFQPINPDEESDDPVSSDDLILNNLTYNSIVDIALGKVFTTVGGISNVKLSDNSGWWVTPVEIEAALSKFDSMSLDEFFKKILDAGCAVAGQSARYDNMFSKPGQSVTDFSEEELFIMALNTFVSTDISLWFSAIKTYSSHEVKEQIRILKYKDGDEDGKTVENSATRAYNNLIFFMKFMVYISSAAEFGEGFYVW